MNRKELLELSDVELLKKARKLTSDSIIDAVLIGFCVGIIIWSAAKIYKKELVELLFEQPYSKIEYIVGRLEVERKAASRYLRELENIGILESKKIGREKLYMNIGLIEILKK